MAYRSAAAKPGADRAGDGSSRVWDELRREARRLEGDLDARLAAFAKLCGGYESSFRLKSDAIDMSATKSSEIEALLQRLSDVNDDMSGATSGASDSRAHILARHRDILSELTSEYRRLKASLSAARDRANLLGGAETSPLLSVQVHTPGSMALRERSSLAASNSATDEVLAQAQSIGASLAEQRRLLEGGLDRMLSLGEKFPAIGGLLTAIRRRKSKDALVLSAVVALCTFFMLIYFVRK